MRRRDHARLGCHADPPPVVGHGKRRPLVDVIAGARRELKRQVLVARVLKDPVAASAVAECLDHLLGAPRVIFIVDHARVNSLEIGVRGGDERAGFLPDAGLDRLDEVVAVRSVGESAAELQVRLDTGRWVHELRIAHGLRQEER